MFRSRAIDFTDINDEQDTVEINFSIFVKEKFKISHTYLRQKRSLHLSTIFSLYIRRATSTGFSKLR